MTRRLLTSALVLTLLTTGATLAAKPSNLLEADGCDVMVLVEELPPAGHAGRYLLESVFSGERYTYTFDGTPTLQSFAPDFSSLRQTLYVNWRLEEITQAKGTNRTVITFDLTQTPPYPFSFDGQIIRGKRFPNGGIGGHGIYDPDTGILTYSQVDLVFCQKASGGRDD